MIHPSNQHVQRLHPVYNMGIAWLNHNMFCSAIAFAFSHCLHVNCSYNLFKIMLKKHLFKKIRTDRPSARAHDLPDAHA